MKILLNVDMVSFAMLTTEGIPVDRVGLQEMPDGSFGLGISQSEEQQLATQETLGKIATAMGGAPPQQRAAPVMTAQPGQLICPKCKKPLLAHTTPCV